MQSVVELLSCWVVVLVRTSSGQDTTSYIVGSLAWRLTPPANRAAAVAELAGACVEGVP